MKIELSSKQFRRLLDLVYIGNWVLNSARGSDRIKDFDDLESYLFSLCPKCGMDTLVDLSGDEPLPSVAFSEGGIHEAIMDYEDTVFFEILAEELAHRDISESDGDQEELSHRINEYIAEFEKNGVENISVEGDF